MRYLIFIFTVFVIFFVAESFADDVNTGPLIGDASIESDRITHSKIDSTGGLNKSGGTYFGVDVNIAGFPISINKKSLNSYRGPDVINPCAYFSASSVSSSATDCIAIGSVTSSIITCAQGQYIDENGDCQSDCPGNKIPDPNNAGGCICATGKHEDNPGSNNCICDTAGQVDYGRGCVTPCPGNMVDPQNDGSCECPQGKTDPDANNICGKDCTGVLAGQCEDKNDTGCKTICTAPMVDTENTCDTQKCCPVGLKYRDVSQKCEPFNPCPGEKELDPNTGLCACPYPKVDSVNGNNECDCGTWAEEDPEPDLTKNKVCICIDSANAYMKSDGSCACRNPAQRRNSAGQCY